MQFFVVGLVLMAAFYLLSRLFFVITYHKTEGRLAYYVEQETTEGKLIFPVIVYALNDSTYQLMGREGTSYNLNDELQLLVKQHPEQTILYTVQSFWLYPLFYLLLPLILWSAFALSYVGKYDCIRVQLRFPFFTRTSAKV